MQPAVASTSFSIGDKATCLTREMSMRMSSSPGVLVMKRRLYMRADTRRIAMELRTIPTITKAGPSVTGLA
jgi:hypothetical protein